jgi:hypothetical protein
MKSTIQGAGRGKKRSILGLPACDVKKPAARGGIEPSRAGSWLGSVKLGKIEPSLPAWARLDAEKTLEKRLVARLERLVARSNGSSSRP